jgi:very-short-patch-repair endonuclease
MAKEKDRLYRYLKVCKKCNESFYAQKLSSEFCSRSCAISWRNSNNPAITKKITESLKKNGKLKTLVQLAHSPEASAKRKKSNENQWKNPHIRKQMITNQIQSYKNNPEIVKERMKKIDTPEWRQKLSAATKKRWDNDYAGMIRKCILPTLNLYNSSLEQKFEQYCIENDIKYERQFILENKVYDFYLPDSNTLVECDGIFFHPKKEEDCVYDIQKMNFENDKIKTLLVEQKGYKLIRIGS